jgi:hypothetical protein
MKLAIFTAILLAGCIWSPGVETADVHVYTSTWSYDAPDEIIFRTAFLHCGNSELDGVGKGRLQSWDGANPREILVNQLGRDSDRIDGLGEESYYAKELLVISPIDGKAIVVQFDNLPQTFTETREMEGDDGMWHPVTETVTVEDLGMYRIKIDRRSTSCM